MGKKPKLLYTDDEGSLHKPAIIEYFKQQHITHCITRNHAFFAERMIRTFKGLLSKRIEHTKDVNPQWIYYSFQIMLTYNNKMISSSTKLTPQYASKPSNEIDVKMNIELRASHTRKYPELTVGNIIRICRKKTLGEKEHVISFSK